MGIPSVNPIIFIVFAQKRDSLGSTDKFGTTILTHLFCPHFGGKSSTEHHSASGFPPRSDEKIYANLADLIFISDSLVISTKKGELPFLGGIFVVE